MKKITLLAAFLTVFLFGSPGYAQDMPPGNLIVVTACLINDGNTVADVMSAARDVDYDYPNAPNFVFYRQPIAGGNTPENLLMRVIYWRDMAHWATPGQGDGGLDRDRRRVAEMLDCDTANRTFSMNYNAGPGGQPYDNGESDFSFAVTRTCQFKPGYGVADVYSSLTAYAAGLRERGDTTLVQLSHRFLGPSNGVEMGTRFLIRLTGTTPQSLADQIDASPKGVGTPAAFPGMNCSDGTLWGSHVVHWGLVAAN